MPRFTVELVYRLFNVLPLPHNGGDKDITHCDRDIRVSLLKQQHKTYVIFEKCVISIIITIQYYFCRIKSTLTQNTVGHSYIDYQLVQGNYKINPKMEYIISSKLIDKKHDDDANPLPQKQMHNVYAYISRIPITRFFFNYPLPQYIYIGISHFHQSFRIYADNHKIYRGLYIYSYFVIVLV